MWLRGGKSGEGVTALVLIKLLFLVTSENVNALLMRPVRLIEDASENGILFVAMILLMSFWINHSLQDLSVDGCPSLQKMQFTEDGWWF